MSDRGAIYLRTSPEQCDGGAQVGKLPRSISVSGFRVPRAPQRRVDGKTGQTGRAQEFRMGVSPFYGKKA